MGGGWAGALEAPQDKYGQEHRTGTSRVEQTDRDHGGAGSSGSHGGAGSSGGHGGAGISGGHGGSWRHGRELWRPWQMVFGALASVPSAWPLQPELLLPPKKFPWGSEGVSEPSGAKQTGQYKTRQEHPPGPDRQDRIAHRNLKPSWAGLEAEASSGHDQESEAHKGTLSDRLHISDKGAGG